MTKEQVDQLIEDHYEGYIKSIRHMSHCTNQEAQDKLHDLYKGYIMAIQYFGEPAQTFDEHVHRVCGT